MIGALARKLFGSSNERRIKSYTPRVAAINALEKELEKLTDEALRARTEALKKRVAEGASLDDVLVEAFATVREAGKRTLGQRHFDVQLMGGMVLHEGRISEMKTGEGKTLVATLPVYLNALSGRGVHVVTVNDYLAKRDAEWMGQIYNFLGLTVGVIVHGMDDEQRKQAYDCDVTYGTNNELGFDYLRDNMKYRLEDMVQRGHIYAIVDEVDSILIDEARTPLIISGPLDDRSDFYNTIDAFIPRLEKADYEVDEKQRTVTMTEQGTEKMEQMLREAGLLKSDSLYDVENVSVVHHVNQALRAHKLFQRDKDYIVRNGEVVIIDEFTGRMMPGRRYSEGLHQALEGKEHQPIQPENQTLASITFQNYFRMYEKLAGMTGTAMTEADEFIDIYNLEVIEVPTNMPMVRLDDDDEVYRTAAEKYRAILSLIDDCKARGQPVLVGTTSIEKSEQLAEMLRQAGWERTTSPTRMRSRRSIRATTAPPRPRCSPSSTPATTSRRPISSRRQGCRARLPSPPTWPAAAPTSSSAAMPTCAFARKSPTSPTLRSASAIRGRPPSATRSSGSRRRRSARAACSCSAPSATRAAASTTSCAAAPAARAIPGIRSSSCRSRTT